MVMAGERAVLAAAAVPTTRACEEAAQKESTRSSRTSMFAWGAGVARASEVVRDEFVPSVSEPAARGFGGSECIVRALCCRKEPCQGGEWLQLLSWSGRDSDGHHHVL